jgi:hypothetical protein
LRIERVRILPVDRIEAGAGCAACSRSCVAARASRSAAAATRRRRWRGRHG